ncbi:MAG: hypothetical protein VX878_11955 [Pseudomonadota bacterium]|nr:hypothetical protein [Pseudomonadota bacterium]
MFGISRSKRSRHDGIGQGSSAAPGAQHAPSELPVRNETRHDRGRNVYFQKGQFLARQDRWDMLGRLIAETDRTKGATPAGDSLAALLAVGARDDAVRHARGAIQGKACPVPAGIDALTELTQDMPNTYAIFLVAARAQIDCAWAYEGQVDPYAMPRVASEAFLDRFDVASELLAQAEALAPESVEVAATKCDLLAAVPGAEDLVDALHRDVIRADPGNPGRLRSYGVHLLPRWFGSYSHLARMSETLSQEAQPIWGNQAYAWMWFDALRLDPEAAEELDVDRFLAGLDEILASSENAHLANLISAYVDGMKPAAAPDDLSAGAMAVRQHIHAALPALTARHLTELHPQVWARADALPGASHAGPLSAGRIAAATAQARSAVEAALSIRLHPAPAGMGRSA